MRSLACSHIRASAGSTFLRRPGRRDSSPPTMSMPSFMRTLDQHRTTTNRTPARKSFTHSDSRSSSGYRKTPRFPVDVEPSEQSMHVDILSYGAITSNHTENTDSTEPTMIDIYRQADFTVDCKSHCQSVRHETAIHKRNKTVSLHDDSR
jgi:hypothetical protein